MMLGIKQFADEESYRMTITIVVYSDSTGSMRRAVDPLSLQRRPFLPQNRHQEFANISLWG